MAQIIKIIVKICKFCLKNELHQPKQPSPGMTKKESCPGVYWQIDFPELLLHSGYNFRMTRTIPFSHKQSLKSSEVFIRRNTQVYGTFRDILRQRSTFHCRNNAKSS